MGGLSERCVCLQGELCGSVHVWIQKDCLLAGSDCHSWLMCLTLSWDNSSSVCYEGVCVSSLVSDSQCICVFPSSIVCVFFWLRLAPLSVGVCVCVYYLFPCCQFVCQFLFTLN